jgi:hypothetical protein
MDLRFWPQSRASGQQADPLAGSFTKQARLHATIAQVNATGGIDIVPAKRGFKYRLIDAFMISVGGAAAGATTVDILGTLSGSTRKLVANAVAGLTQSAVLRPGAANSTVLADGASYTVNDDNKPLTLSKTGSAITTATFIDVVVIYAVELS